MRAKKPIEELETEIAEVKQAMKITMQFIAIKVVQLILLIGLIYCAHHHYENSLMLLTAIFITTCIIEFLWHRNNPGHLFKH